MMIENAFNEINYELITTFGPAAVHTDGFEAYLPPPIHWLPTHIQDLGHDLDDSILPIHVPIHWPHFLNILVF